MLAAIHLLAALDMDPTVRGLAIVIASVIILPGSVFLLLSTNLGARLGFLLALTGFFGWLTVQGIIWTVFAQGNRGTEPHWETKEIVTGAVSQSTIEAMDGFPAGWNKLEPGDRILGDAQAAADEVLSKAGAEAGAEAGHGGGGEEHAPEFEAPFSVPEDYVAIGGYNRGGETYALTFLHKPHYAVVQVQPVIEQEAKPGEAPPRPRADLTKPVTTVVMVRNLGSVRLPPFLLAVSSGIIFLVLVSILHRRDKQIMALRAAAA